jgi:hypothetical protein
MKNLVLDTIFVPFYYTKITRTDISKLFINMLSIYIYYQILIHFLHGFALLSPIFFLETLAI